MRLCSTWRRWTNDYRIFGSAKILRHFGRASRVPGGGWSRHLVGDRQLPHPGVESIVESYYRFLIGPWQLTADMHQAPRAHLFPYAVKM